MSKHLRFPVTEAKNKDLFARMAALQVREEDLGESYFKTIKSGGKSGLLGVVIHHPASGLRIRCERERSQGINRFLARRMLVERLEKIAQKAAQPPLVNPVSGKNAAAPPQLLTLPRPPAHWGLDSSGTPGDESTSEFS